MSDLERRAAQQRLLVVHAHPGRVDLHRGHHGRLRGQGVQVRLVTCTLGELGEIIPPSLAHVAAEKEDWLGSNGSASWKPPALRSV